MFLYDSIASLTEKRCLLSCCWHDSQVLPALLTVISAYFSISTFVRCDTTAILCFLPTFMSFTPVIMGFSPLQTSFAPSVFSFKPVLFSFAPKFFSSTPSLFCFNPVLFSVIPEVGCYSPSYFTYSPKIYCVTDWKQILGCLPFISIYFKDRAKDEEPCEKSSTASKLKSELTGKSSPEKPRILSREAQQPSNKVSQEFIRMLSPQKAPLAPQNAPLPQQKAQAPAVEPKKVCCKHQHYQQHCNQNPHYRPKPQQYYKPCKECKTSICATPDEVRTIKKSVDDWSCRAENEAMAIIKAGSPTESYDCGDTGGNTCCELHDHCDMPRNDYGMHCYF